MFVRGLIVCQVVRSFCFNGLFLIVNMKKFYCLVFLKLQFLTSVFKKHLFKFWKLHFKYPTTGILNYLLLHFLLPFIILEKIRFLFLQLASRWRVLKFWGPGSFAIDGLRLGIKSTTENRCYSGKFSSGLLTRSNNLKKT